MAEGMDPNLLQDFLTESQELIGQLDNDLVTLESLGLGAEAAERLNSIFRALHTIKGAASFLGLTVITHFAHAAEDALNLLRKGQTKITPAIMDALLQSVDVVRRMIDELSQGKTIAPGPDDLIAVLHDIAQGKAQADTAGPEGIDGDQANDPALKGTTSQQADESTPTVQLRDGEKPLTLHDAKLDLLPFMVDDLRQQAQKLDQALHQAAALASREEGAKDLWQIAGELSTTAEFFQLPGLTTLTTLLARSAAALPTLSNDVAQDLLPRLEGIRHLIEQQAQALERQVELVWPLPTLQQRIEHLLTGQTLPQEAACSSDDPLAVLRHDGVLVTPAQDKNTSPAAAPSEAQTPVAGTENGTAPAPAPTAGPADHGEQNQNKTAPPTQATAVEQTIRVEVGRLEALLNLVGQLVLTKNRVLAISRKCREHNVPIELIENAAGAAGDLDRLTSELQVGVMRTRMQPLAKLFERYPRVIRDISRALGKKINLEVVGKETEVDKSVLELLADPLVHILRNAADHGVEQPQTRTAAGKEATGTIRLAAEHQGSHVRVEIRDDGKGLDRDVLLRKAIEKGLTTPTLGAALTNEEVYRFIFAAGFSTAEKVTDLSGRGVGMDVVRTNIAKLNGTVNVYSNKGKGTTIEILIPLTVAIMPAMVVGVDQALYCIPLQSILEIVKPEKSMIYSVRGAPVMRLRDAVLPLIDLRQRLGVAQAARETDQRFAVVVGVGGERAGLLVDRLIGQQEIVIKPLDDRYASGGPFSGATIREDGDVSLILDIIQLIRQSASGGAGGSGGPGNEGERKAA